MTFQTEGFRDWKNAVGEKRGIISNHEKTPGHMTASTLAENFLSVTKGQMENIQSVISKTYSDKVEKNRKTLLSILDVVINLGQRNVAFRGNWKGDSEDGNFIHFIQWKSHFDDVLSQHLETAPGNAKYLSPIIQNEMISCCGDEIRDFIVRRIQKSKYFSVLADETADISGTEQLSICIRYVSESDNFEIHEDFLGFCPLLKQDSESITKAIIEQLSKWGLHVSLLRGQGYDGASNMSGRLSGVQKRIQEVQPRALYTHCRSHALNLVVVHGCTDVPIVRNTMTLIEKVAVFFSAGTRKHKLQDILQEQGSDDGPRGIPLMSDTRWGSRIKTVSAFISKLEPTHSALQEIESDCTHNSEKASRLRNSIESFDTIITSVVTQNVLGYIWPLTLKLQSPNVDLSSAYKEGRQLAEVIESLRNDEERFCKIYQQAVQLANAIDVTPVKKRIVVKQQHRGNVPAQSIAEHYRLNLFIPFIDHVTNELRTRLAESTEPALLAAYLVPEALPQLSEERENRLLAWYKEDLPYPDTAEQEIHRWKHQFQNHTGPLPATAMETLQNGILEFYPNVKCMLLLFLTLPVTTCSCERSFSALRRLKTWLRSTMGDERLSSLALMHVHQNIEIDPHRVLQRWDASGHRRILTCFDKR